MPFISRSILIVYPPYASVRLKHRLFWSVKAEVCCYFRVVDWSAEALVHFSAWGEPDVADFSSTEAVACHHQFDEKSREQREEEKQCLVFTSDV